MEVNRLSKKASVLSFSAFHVIFSIDLLKYNDGHTFCFLLKGYLCYKTITSQKVSSEAEVKDFFIS